MDPISQLDEIVPLLDEPRRLARRRAARAADALRQLQPAPGARAHDRRRDAVRCRVPWQHAPATRRCHGTSSPRSRRSWRSSHDAMRSPGALDRTIAAPFGDVPGETFARFVALDGLVHGWDIATATGQAYDPPADLVAEIDAFARAGHQPTASATATRSRPRPRRPPARRRSSASSRSPGEGSPDGSRLVAPPLLAPPAAQDDPCSPEPRWVSRPMRCGRREADASAMTNTTTATTVVGRLRGRQDRAAGDLELRRLRRHRHHAADHRRAAVRGGRRVGRPARARRRRRQRQRLARRRSPRAAEVTATDYVGALLEGTAARAAAEGLAIECREADAEALPFEDGSFDVVLSTFGVMFTPNQERAAAELQRVCRAGGRDRPRQLDAVRLHRPDVQGRRWLRPAARRRPLAAARGAPRTGSPSCSPATRGRDRRPPVRLPLPRRRRTGSTRSARTTARRSRPSAPSTSQARSAFERDLLALAESRQHRHRRDAPRPERLPRGRRHDTATEHDRGSRCESRRTTSRRKIDVPGAVARQTRRLRRRVEARSACRRVLLARRRHRHRAAAEGPRGRRLPGTALGLRASRATLVVSLHRRQRGHLRRRATSSTGRPATACVSSRTPRSSCSARMLEHAAVMDHMRANMGL